MKPSHPWLRASLALALLAWSSCHAQILIGQTVGVTGSAAATVQEASQGASLYLDHVNAKGGVGGQKIELLTLDDKFDTKLTLDNARVLIEQKGVLGLFMTQLQRELRRTSPGEAMLERLDRELSLERERIDKLRADDRKTDADRLTQVVLNLLSNALKYAPRENGQVVLRLDCDGGSVRIEVQDNGPGIPADQQAMVFEKFRQVAGDAHYRPGGTGLGLPISRQIVAHFGGRMCLQSVPGQGAVFGFSLPRRFDDTSAAGDPP